MTKTDFATTMEPHLTPLLTGMSNWVSSHGPDIDHVFDRIGNTLEHVDWKGIERRVTQIGDAATYTADRLERVSKFVGEVNEGTKHPVKAVGGLLSEFNDFLWKHGWDPNAGFRDAAANNPQVGAELMRRGLLPGPEEGMSVPPRPRAPSSSQNINSATKAAFLEKWRPEAERIAGRVGTSPDNILAHWAQETGWGTHEHDNNVGNLQALRAGPNTVTRADTRADGSSYQAPFLAFRTPAESAEAYASWVERYGAVGPGAGDRPEEFGGRLRASHYMENPNAPADIAAARRQVERQRTAIPGSDRLAPAAPALARSDAQPTAAPASPAGGSASKEISDFLNSQIRQQQSTVQIDINHNGAPSGVTMDAKATGAAEVGNIRVARAMPDGDGRRDRY